MGKSYKERPDKYKYQNIKKKKNNKKGHRPQIDNDERNENQNYN